MVYQICQKRQQKFLINNKQLVGKTAIFILDFSTESKILKIFCYHN